MGNKGRGGSSSARGAHPANGRGHNGRNGGNRYLNTFEKVDNLTGGQMQAKVEELAPDDPVYYFDLDIQYRCERPIPCYLEDNEIEGLRKIRKHARTLDCSFRIYKFKFGRTMLLGFIPGAGPVADLVLGLNLVYRPARKLLDKQARKKFTVLKWQIISFLISFFAPEVGDFISALIKVNKYCVARLEECMMEMANRRAAKMSEDEKERYEEKWREDRKRAISAAEKEKHRKEHCCGGCCIA